MALSALKYSVRIKEGALPERRDVCTIGISVGEHFHEGEKFIATLEWASAHFYKLHIFVCDTIHRFNFSCLYRGDIKGATSLAKKAGDEWIERNESALEQIKVPYEISRWDDWVSYSFFPSLHQSILELHRKNSSFHSFLESDARRFLDSNWEKLKEEGLSYDAWLGGGVSYMLEELSVLSIISQEVSPFEIYAGPDSKAAAACRQGVIGGAPLGLVSRRPIRIDFKKKARN